MATAAAYRFAQRDRGNGVDSCVAPVSVRVRQEDAVTYRYGVEVYMLGRMANALERFRPALSHIFPISISQPNHPPLCYLLDLLTQNIPLESTGDLDSSLEHLARTIPHKRSDL